MTRPGSRILRNGSASPINPPSTISPVTSTRFVIRTRSSSSSSASANASPCYSTPITERNSRDDPYPDPRHRWTTNSNACSNGCGYPTSAAPRPSARGAGHRESATPSHHRMVRAMAMPSRAERDVANTSAGNAPALPIARPAPRFLRRRVGQGGQALEADGLLSARASTTMMLSSFESPSSDKIAAMRA